jgi:glycosyltransferase involved in cell wall biosynthesis
LTALGRDVRTVALTAAEGTTVDVPALGERSLSFATITQLRRSIRDVDHVIANGSRAVPACAAAQLLSRRRFVYRSIGDAVFYARSRARRARVTLYLRKAEAVVALWPGSADALSERYGVPAERITVIPTGVPADRFPPVDAAGRAAARASLGLGDDARVALCLGWLDAEKAVHVAINAIGSLTDVTLLIAGDGPERAALERMAADVAPGRVRFLGTVSGASSVLRASDVFVLPSLTEGLPAVVIEAGLTGIPVVTTDVGAIRSVIRDDETGVIVPTNDVAALANGMRRVLDDGGDLARGLQRHCLDHFEMNVVARAWDALLTDLSR